MLNLLLNTETIATIADTTAKTADTVATAVTSTNNSLFNDTFWQALTITGQGMGGILAFMFMFYLVILGMDKLFPKKADEDK